MPRSKRHYKGNNKSDDRKKRRENENSWKSGRGPAEGKSVPKNPKFEMFYKLQGFFVDKKDYDDFLSCLKSPLPACFRINPDYEFASNLKEQLHQFVGKSMRIYDREVQPVQNMAWYPGECAYKLGMDRRMIRKTVELEPLHAWLIRHTDCGNITRQEAVSMVPPLALDVQPHNKCLDLCAAPGSKTSQMLEIINRSFFSPPELQGVVVANDADTDRAYMLVHQCRRINSPFLTVTTHKGQDFPRLRDVSSDESPSPPTKKPSGYFDRVLCDVPCSGDGTLRKSPNIWSVWAAGSGIALHPLQLMIAQRGLLVLKPGGLMVYSTCSMSPCEDEAVVAQLLRTNKGIIELVDARAQYLPTFRCRPGVSTWLVLDDIRSKPNSDKAKDHSHRNKRQKSEPVIGLEQAVDIEGGEAVILEEATEESGVMVAEKEADSSATAIREGNPSEAMGERGGEEEGWRVPDISTLKAVGLTLYTSAEEVEGSVELGLPEKKRLRRSLFPPSDEEVQWMHLERCMRCLPHDEDTGGFFVATFRKIAQPSAPSTEEVGQLADEPVVANQSIYGPGGDGPDTDALEAAAAAAAAVDGDAVDVRAGEENKSEGKRVFERTKGGGRGDGGGRGSKGLTEYKQWSREGYDKLNEFYGFLPALTIECLYVREEILGTPKNNDSKGIKGNGNGQDPSAAPPKSIYFIPLSIRKVMEGDTAGLLKIVSAGVKVFERSAGGGRSGLGTCEYRLLQEGIHVLEPHLSEKRKVIVNIQDFCNILEGGFVSLSTLSAVSVQRLLALPPGAALVIYEWDPKDVIISNGSAQEEGKCEGAVSTRAVGGDPLVPKADTALLAPVDSLSEEAGEEGKSKSKKHRFVLVCWRSGARGLNSMCSKIEIEFIKHQLSSLQVLREKIAAPKAGVAPSSAIKDVNSPSTASGPIGSLKGVGMSVGSVWPREEEELDEDDQQVLSEIMAVDEDETVEAMRYVLGKEALKRGHPATDSNDDDGNETEELVDVDEVGEVKGTPHSEG